MCIDANNFCENTKKGMLSLSAEAKFNNFKAILMQVIVGSVKRWSNNFCANKKMYAKFMCKKG